MKLLNGRKLRIFLVIMLSMTIAIFSQPKALVENNVPGELSSRLKDAVVMYVGNSTAYVNNMRVQIDAANPEVVPFTKNNTVYVPLRFAAEKLGGKVAWDESTKAIRVDLKNKSAKFILNGTNKALGVRAEQIGDTSYVPLRLFAQAIGKKFFCYKGLIIISDKTRIINLSSEKILYDELVSRINTLPTVDTFENLKTLIEKANGGSGNIRMYASDAFLGAPITNSKNAVEESAQKSTTSGSSDYSKTNVQVDGVDEADVVKTDGEYIYQVNKQRILVIKANPADEMKVVSQLDFKSSPNSNGIIEKDFTPQEMYIDGKYLVVIGNEYDQMVHITEDTNININAKVMPSIYPYYSNKNMTKAIIYDLSDKSNLKKIREVEVEGNYVSSRKVRSSLYLISNKNVWYYENMDEKNIVPSYRDTAVSKNYESVDCKDIKYFPGSLESNFMNIAAVDLNTNDAASISSYLGASQNIYASTQNLYIAAANYNYGPLYGGIVRTQIMQQNESSTLVYKFALDKQNVTYKGKAEVPGTILNQFSMDEDNGNFRIATTVGEVSRTNSTSKNNVYVLDKDLNMVGKIEDIAPGEKIYSVRFMGKKAYVVTFKKVDPLFVLDLSEPTNPKILGKLKIPGFSDYLHPYDENHIIGFGKDTVEAKEGNFAWYQGMKIAMFDVSDVNNPKEMFKEVIGDRGTDSELLYNHKALLFSKEKNLLAFPVTVAKINNKQEDQSESPQYGEFEFQGAYVYNIDLVNGFTLKGRITHISNEEYSKAGSYWSDFDKSVQRVLYIGDKLYTLSNGMIKANNLDNLKEVNSVKLK